jgi:PRTRC genetic system protein E
MFKELDQSLKVMDFKAVGLVIVKDGDEMLKVTVSPLATDGQPVQNLQITDTPENLDAQFAGLLEEYRTAVAKPKAGNNMAEIRKAAGLNKKDKAKDAAKHDEKKPKVQEPKKEEQPKVIGQKCRVCGCTNDHACEGGCHWVEKDLCSKCAEKMKEKQEAPKAETPAAAPAAADSSAQGLDFDFN